MTQKRNEWKLLKGENNRTGRFLQQFDWFLFLNVLVASIFGLMMIFSATRSYDNHLQYVFIQSGALFLGLIVLFLMTLIDYESMGEAYTYIYGFCIFLLLLTLVFGQGEKEVGGRSWIRFGSIGIQPAELVKIGFIVTFAKHLEMAEEDINSPRNLLMLIMHLGILVALILLQPDAGTAMMFTGIFIGMTFAAGVKIRYYLTAIGGFLVTAPIAWFFILKPYQKDRILVFLNPETDPLGAGYQVVQSKIAIGAGLLTGQGYGKGVLTQLGLLPAKHTDFIFAAIGEELGFAGSVFILILLFSLIGRCLVVALTSKNSLGKYISVGVATMFFVQTLENVGMCIGLVPVTGITLPFMSYGGSSLLTNLLATGLMMSVSIRRKTLQF